MEDLLRRNRQRVDEETRNGDRRRYFSPATYAAYQPTVSAILTHAHGRVIDVGCGDMPYKTVILQRATQYDTIDVERRVPDVKYVADVGDMSIVGDASYDTAVCLFVLEHVPDPFRAMGEIARILVEGGSLILTVPHLSRLHEEPNDFYRYTKYGVRALVERAGLEVIEITPLGGLFSFLGQQLSVVFVCSVWHIPVLKRIAFFINSWLCVRPCHWLDRVLDRRKIFALSYLCVARKKRHQ